MPSFSERVTMLILEFEMPSFSERVTMLILEFEMPTCSVRILTIESWSVNPRLSVSAILFPLTLKANEKGPGLSIAVPVLDVIAVEP